MASTSPKSTENSRTSPVHRHLSVKTNHHRGANNNNDKANNNTRKSENTRRQCGRDRRGLQVFQTAVTDSLTWKSSDGTARDSPLVRMFQAIDETADGSCGWLRQSPPSDPNNNSSSLSPQDEKNIITCLLLIAGLKTRGLGIKKHLAHAWKVNVKTIEQIQREMQHGSILVAIEDEDENDDDVEEENENEKEENRDEEESTLRSRYTLDNIATTTTETKDERFSSMNSSLLDDEPLSPTSNTYATGPLSPTSNTFVTGALSPTSNTQYSECLSPISNATTRYPEESFLADCFFDCYR